MKGRKKGLGVLVYALIAVVALGVGYAAINNIQLTIDGSATASASQDNFIVEFSGTPTTGGDGTTTATIDNSDKTLAHMTVTGLTAAGQAATATYTIENKSPDLSAAISVNATATKKDDNSDTENYFTITQSIANPTTITKTGSATNTTTVTVTVTLNKTPVDADKTVDFTVALDAQPVQP